MSVITRASIPQDFIDRVDDQMLIQPEPQYLHAALAKMALSYSFDVQAGMMMGIVPSQSIPSRGASVLPLEQERLMLSDQVPAQAIRAIPQIGKVTGEVIKFNRRKFADSTYTQASREIAAGALISKTPIDISMEQVPLTIRRYAGPYDSGAGQVRPYGIDAFPASMSIHNLVEEIGMHLKRDYDKTLDRFICEAFDNIAAGNIIRPLGMSSDNSSTVAGDYPMDLVTFFDAENKLDELNIPYFSDGFRYAVLSPRQLNQLKRDPAFLQQSSFHPNINPLLTGAYERTLSKTHIFKSNTLTKVTNVNSVPIHYGQMFGPGGVGYGVSMLPHIEPDSDTNFNQQNKVIWVTCACIGTLDNTFSVRITTS